MKGLRSWVLCGALILAARVGFSASPTFSVPGDPVELVRDTDRFTRFAQSVARQVDELLKAPPDAATESMLLAMRVHLAIHLREDARALECAERIRAGQTDPGERAHSGLTTRALVASHGEPVRFGAEFTQLLCRLPPDPGIRAALVRARQKIEQVTEESLLADIRENVAPRLARGEPCTLELADKLVRAGHRLRMILPLRVAMLNAYATAIAVQDHPR